MKLAHDSPIRSMIIVTSAIMLLVAYGFTTWEAISPDLPRFHIFIPAFVMLVDLIAFILNVGKAIRSISQHRWIRVMIHLSVLVACVFLWPYSFWATNKHIEARHSHFYDYRLTRYEALVEQLSRTPDLLVGKIRVIDGIRVYGRTNVDGSLTLWFPGLDGHLDSGYLFHSGERLSMFPGLSTSTSLTPDPNHYFCHMTNGWYEY